VTPFRFRLAPLLRIRERLERAALAAVAAARAGLREAEAALQGERAQEARLLADMESGPGALDARRRLVEDEALDRRRARIARAGDRVAEQAREVDRRAEEHLGTRREVRMLEALRSRRWSEHVREADRVEQAGVDEAAREAFRRRAEESQS